ncbi:MAG: glycosyltransferase [Tannerellaceae bacterium]|nr:glycosyltransferase [Tannerellaceae bacterium]
MVSVCIATYNGEKYLKEQIDSILIQLEGEDELIISDDNSTDSTLQILKEYDDARIKTIEANQFNSPIYNFENAIKYSKGNIIILSDQDDIWYPYKVDKIKTFLKKYLLVFSNATIVDEFCHGSMLLYQKKQIIRVF